MTNRIKVDIVSDIVCPWCIIGYKRLEQAAVELGIQSQVDVEWHPFELNPDMPAEGEDLPTYFARKYGMTPEDGIRSRANIAALGAELGFTFDFFDGMKKCNTRDAHVLLDFAKQHGKQTELKLRLFHAYFSERKDISDRVVLARELAAVGLCADAGMAHLEDDMAYERVRTQSSHWRSKGVSSVPTIIVNNDIAVTGAQAVEDYKTILKEQISSQH